MFAQQLVSILDLNTYDNLTEFNQDSIQAQAYNGVEVQFTAVIVSYPKSSGLATPTDDDGDGVIDRISRIHVFVTDTAAVTQGRDGMSIQLVESDYDLLEGFVRGDVVTFTGSLGFFNATAQVAVFTTEVLGNVNSEYPEYASLLEPWEVTVDELNTLNEDGTHEVNIANYGKYNGAYVKVTNAAVSNVSLGDRPNWAVSNSGSRIYVYDTSLRFRNDRVNYLPSYNYRHGDDVTFEPPAPGAIVNLSGFVNMVGDNPDGNVTAGSQAFSINPFEDGYLWTGGERYADGETIPGVGVLNWPNDLEIVGLPPVFSEVSQSDSSVTSSDAITVTATVVAATEGSTITNVKLIYSAGATIDTLDMTGTGDVYTTTIPAQSNFTPVSFYMLATDSDGLVGRAPIAGQYGYFVQDGPINSVSLLQQTADGGPGASPLAGAGSQSMSISGLIVSDFSDGVIVLQDAAAPWSGIFLEHTSMTDALVRGDSITVTSGEVIEATVASNSLTLTQLVNVSFTFNSGANDISAVIPVIKTDSIAAWSQDGEMEAYEGMVVKFEDAQVIARGNFGEYTLANIDATGSGGAIFNEDIRSDSQIGSVGVSYDINHSIRMGKTMDAYAIVAASFGAPKFHPRDVNDFITEDGNSFTPVLDFGLVGPVDSASVVVETDIEINWIATEDFDGDDVTYQWVLYSADTSEVIIAVPSNNEGADATVTLGVATIDEILVSAGLDVGQSAQYVWNVRVSDGSDTLDVRGSYGNFGDDFTPIYRTITLERGLINNNEVIDGVPVVFSLEQNYPNPFNPSTNINFALPKASQVSLTVYDMLGRKVATLIDGEQLQAAKHSINFDASALASGMYIYRIEAGSFVSTRKMMLIK